MSVMLILHDPRRPPDPQGHVRAPTRPPPSSPSRTIAQAELSTTPPIPPTASPAPSPQLGGDPKSGAPSAQSAQLIHPDLASGNKAGYTFAITNCNKVTVNNQDMYTSFEVTAVPQSIGKTGDNGYCADENNTIPKTPPAAPTAPSPSSNESAGSRLCL